PYAYNYTVRGNVLLVTLTMQVRSGQVEARALLHGAVLRGEASELASQSHKGQKVLPGLSQAQQLRRTLPSGRSEWQIAFAFPNAALAWAAGDNLRPLGLLAPKPGRAMSATLFQVQSQEHGMYQGEIQFSRFGDSAVPVLVEDTIPTADASYDGVLFRGTSVEYLPGTRYIQLHFTRSDNSGLGLETAQDINLSPDGKGPVAVGTPGWKLSHWVGPEGPHTLMWTLPAEFSDEDMQGVVHELEREWLKPRMLPNGGVPLFAKLKHRDGWTCTLMARVLRSPGQGERPVPGVETPSASSQPNPPTQSIVPASEEETDIERLRMSLVLWRAEREHLAKTFLPTHPKMKELDDRIAVTEAVIQALTKYEKSRAPATFSPIPGLAPGVGNATDPPIMDTSDTALRALSWQTFDQTPGQYWRQLADVRRFREAAELIERYLALHPELDRQEQQSNGANLHFHAAQCHAFAGDKEKAYVHLSQSRHPGAEEKDGLLWNSYVNGTEAFLRDDRTALINAHAKLIRGSVLNKTNLFVLDRLLARLGMPYAEAYDDDTETDHVKLSADSFNRAWELLDKPQRTAEEDAKMLAYSHASLAHWRLRTDVVPRNLSIAYWQLSRIYAVLGQGENAMTYARLCWTVSKDLPNDEKAFYGGYANEAMARAGRVLGDAEMYYISMNNLRSIIRGVQDPSQREQLEKDMKELEINPPPMPTKAGRPA
ncbi:MAG: hypothetical protein ACAH88_10000, partial [Roseimicrobium sp.]